jgi:hypothetical protein
LPRDVSGGQLRTPGLRLVSPQTSSLANERPQARQSNEHKGDAKADHHDLLNAIKFHGQFQFKQVLRVPISPWR